MITLVVCGQCGQGNFASTDHPVIFRCNVCGHTVNEGLDIEMGPDELLTVTDEGLLAFEGIQMNCPHCGTPVEGETPNRYCLNCYWQEENSL